MPAHPRVTKAGRCVSWKGVWEMPFWLIILKLSGVQSDNTEGQSMKSNYSQSAFVFRSTRTQTLCIMIIHLRTTHPKVVSTNRNRAANLPLIEKMVYLGATVNTALELIGIVVRATLDVHLSNSRPRVVSRMVQRQIVSASGRSQVRFRFMASVFWCLVRKWIAHSMFAVYLICCVPFIRQNLFY